jgi:two-component system, chemotaxis family, sensor kinase CheA
MGVQSLVEQLALSSTLCDVTDLGELAKMHTQMGELIRLVEDSPGWSKAGEFARFGAALESLLEGVVLDTFTDVEGVLGEVRKAIDEIQRALRSDGNSAPLPGDTALVERILRMAGQGAGGGGSPAQGDSVRAAALSDGKAEDRASPSPAQAAGAVETSSSSSEDEAAQPLIINRDELEYVKSFVTEAYEHIDNVEAAVLELEQSLEDQARINELFRPFHTIKGMAGFLNLRDINRLTHKAETLLDLARRGQLIFTTDHINLIFATVDVLKEQVGAVAEYLQAPTDVPVPQPDISVLLKQLHAASSGEAAPVPAASVKASAGVSTAQAAQASPEGSSGAAGSPAAVAAGTGGGAASSKSAAKKDSVVRVDTTKLDHLVDMVGELLVAQALVTQNPIVAEHDGLSKDVAQVAKITREVQEIAMSMRMVTLQQTFQKMGRLARDVSQKANKLVDFTVTGEDTELDRNVIEEIGDPLMHMVRNAVDHGIESSDVRVAAGKAARGHLHLHACHQGGNIVIEITDDGHGLDPEKLIRKGIEKGLVSADEQLTEQQAFGLIMQPGFSTAEKVTDISGRGVGMDVVKRNIDKLRGKVEISSRKGQGSKFTVRLPLTLAIIDGMIVGVGKERFIVPTICIDQSLRPEKEKVFTVQNRGEMLQIRGELCPLLRLDALFNIRPERPPIWELMVVIVYVDGRRVGLVVDELIRQQQIVIKTLGEQFKQVQGTSGAAILGDGRIGLILEASGLLSLHRGG